MEISFLKIKRIYIVVIRLINHCIIYRLQILYAKLEYNYVYYITIFKKLSNRLQFLSYPLIKYWQLKVSLDKVSRVESILQSYIYIIYIYINLCTRILKINRLKIPKVQTS